MIFNFNDEINENRIRYELRLHDLDEVNVKHWIKRTGSNKEYHEIGFEEKEEIIEEQL